MSRRQRAPATSQNGRQSLIDSTLTGLYIALLLFGLWKASEARHMPAFSVCGMMACVLYINAEAIQTNYFYLTIGGICFAGGCLTRDWRFRLPCFAHSLLNMWLQICWDLRFEPYWWPKWSYDLYPVTSLSINVLLAVRFAQLPPYTKADPGGRGEPNNA